LFFAGEYCHWPLPRTHPLNIPNSLADKIIVLSAVGALHLRGLGVVAARVLLLVGGDDVFLVHAHVKDYCSKNEGESCNDTGRQQQWRDFTPGKLLM
jgi:hypothetical protein